MKTAVIILSDPKSGSEEALGRLFNALAVAYDYKQANSQVMILFQGTGTRWAGEVTQPEHPAYGLFSQVMDKVVGVSQACADVFGAKEEAIKNGFDLIKDNPVPQTSGLPSLHKLHQDGWQTLIF